MPDNAIFSIKKALTGNSFPTGLTHGEIAINTYDNKLYVGGQTAISSNCVDSVEYIGMLPQTGGVVTKEHFDIIVPAFQAEGIKLGYNISGIQGMSTSTPSLNETAFTNFLNDILGDGTNGWRKMAKESGYTDYVGLDPYLIMLDTETLMSDFASLNHSNNNDPTVINALEYLNRCHVITKQLYPSSILTEYSFPNLPYYFLPIPGDSADWSRIPGGISVTKYESEKSRLQQLLKYRLSYPIAPSGAYRDYIDWGNIAAYAIYYESHSGMVVPNGYLRSAQSQLHKYNMTTMVEGLEGKKPASCILSPWVAQDESTNDKVIFANAADIDRLNSTIGTSSIWSDQTYSDLVLRQVVNSGVRKFIYWMEWVPYFTNRARKCTSSTTSVGNNFWLRYTDPTRGETVGDQETFYSRKVLNDLIADTGVGATVDITDNAAWCGGATAQNYGTDATAYARKTLGIKAAVVKTIRMVQATKALLAGQNTNAYCSPATNTKSLNTVYAHETFSGYPTQGDKWLTGGSEYTWVQGFNGGSWIETNATQVTASPIPKLQQTFNNHPTVKDFGAVGDGKTDDTLSIQTALNTVASMTAFGSATADKFLLFPPGTYIIGPSGAISTGRSSTTNGSTLESCLFLSLTGSLSIVGQNATLSCVPSDPLIPHASHMMFFDSNGYNISIDGLNFQGNNKSIIGLKLLEGYRPFRSSAKVTNCKFENFWTPVPPGFADAKQAAAAGVNGVGGHAEATGIVFYGAYKNVIADKCSIKNVSRQYGAGLFTGYGTCGITIQSGYYGNYDPQDLNYFYSQQSITGYVGCRSATVSNCYIENITSNEPAIPAYDYSYLTDNSIVYTATRLTDNGDCDGLKFFGGYTSGLNYINCRASIYGNHFVNCRGRDIKVQADEVTIVNNTSSMAVFPITSGGVRINCQITSGIVSNNVFNFDPVSTTGGLKSPFIEDGGLIAGGSIVSFYDGYADKRNRAITISNNTVYNNVPTSIGTLQQFFDNTEGEFVDTTPPMYATIRGNKIVGIGGCQRFAVITGRQPNDDVPYHPQYNAYYTISDNVVSKIVGAVGIGALRGQNPAFLMGGADFNKCYISMHGNVNAGGSLVPFFVSSSSTLPQYSAGANVTAYSNTGIGIVGSNDNRLSYNSMIPRLGLLGDPQNPFGGLVSSQTVYLNNEESYVFPNKGYYGYGRFCMLTSNVAYRNYKNALFFSHGSISATKPIDVILNSGDGFTFGTNNATQISNPDIDGFANVWITAEGVTVKNRFGGGTPFTLFSFG
jgi:Pectate lyase superfamily protein